MTDIKTRDLRTAFGNFATGITVITALDKDKKLNGMTANSFSTVSLEPPLISWCIGRESALFNLFEQVEYFAVNILSSDQRSISEVFASSQKNRFLEGPWDVGTHGLPVLKNCACQLICATEHRYPGGDHKILVGRVLEITNNNKMPLIYHGGQYQTLK